MKKLVALTAAAAAITTSLALAPTASAQTETAEIFASVVDRTAHKYGLPAPKIIVKLMLDRDCITIFTCTAGVDDDGNIVLNSTYAAMSPAEFDSMLADDVESGNHPGGCHGIASAAIHEVGHLVDLSKNKRPRQYVARAAQTGRLGGEIHRYGLKEDGTINPGEAVAVAFQAVECGSATPLEQQIYNVLIS